jgi:hypothetical protein
MPSASGTRVGRRCDGRRGWRSWCRRWRLSPGRSSAIPPPPRSPCSAPLRCWAWRTLGVRRSRGHGRTRAPRWWGPGWSCLEPWRREATGRRWPARCWWRSWCSCWGCSAATLPRRRPRCCWRSWWPCRCRSPPPQDGPGSRVGRWRVASLSPPGCCCGRATRARRCGSAPAWPARRWPSCWPIRPRHRRCGIGHARGWRRPGAPTRRHPCDQRDPPAGTGPLSTWSSSWAGPWSSRAVPPRRATRPGRFLRSVPCARRSGRSWRRARACRPAKRDRRT